MSETNETLKDVASAKPQQPTSLNDLKRYSQGTMVELPPFAEGQRFYAVIKRPSMMFLAKSGKIPNHLLATANALFVGQAVRVNSDEKAMENLLEVCEIMAQNCLVSPTYDEIKKSGVHLTDEQYIFIFSYTQRGVQALTTFPTK